MFYVVDLSARRSALSSQPSYPCPRWLSRTQTRKEPPIPCPLTRATPPSRPVSLRMTALLPAAHLPLPTLAPTASDDQATLSLSEHDQAASGNERVTPKLRSNSVDWQTSPWRPSLRNWSRTARKLPAWPNSAATTV